MSVSSKAGDNFAELKPVLSSIGHVLSVAGNIEELKPHFNLDPNPALEELNYALSLGFPLSGPVFEEITTGPTQLYKHHYKAVNYFLDQAALKLMVHIKSKGHEALPIPASHFKDPQTQSAHLSHKMIAAHLGMGWIGRNILLVTETTGSRIRLATILTSMPLESGRLYKGDIYDGCGECCDCLEVCPAGAIKDSPKEFDLPACAAQTKDFSKHLGVRICGICIRECRPKTSARH